MRRISLRAGRRMALFGVGLLVWAAAAGPAPAAVKTIEATGGNAWNPTPAAAAVGDEVEWKVAAGTHGVRVTNWAAVKDVLEVVDVAGQEPFDAAAGRNPNSTNAAGKVLLRVKVKSVPAAPAPAEITYNCIVHGVTMAGKVTLSAANAGLVPDPADRIRNVRMRTQDGQEVRFYDDLVKNKVVVVNLFYTTCTTCELATKNLEQLQLALGNRLNRDVFMLSISIDPETDNPTALKAYAEKHKAKPGWTFLTPSADDIPAVRDWLQLASLSPEIRDKTGQSQRNVDAAAGQKLHPGMMVIRNDGFNRSVQKKVLTPPAEVLQAIERMQPPPVAGK